MSDQPTIPDLPPVIYVYGKRVREHHVRQCMDDMGDLARYEAGRISTADAYRMTANWLRQLMEMPR